MSVLVYLESYGERLPKTSLATLKAAQEVATSLKIEKLYGVLIGAHGTKAVAEQLSHYGLEEVLYVEADRLKNYLAVQYQSVILEVANQLKATVLVGLASSRGKDLFPRLAAEFSAGQASDCIAVLADGLLKRPIYAGNIIATVKINTAHKVITVRGSAFEQPLLLHGAVCGIRAIDWSGISDSSMEFLQFDSTKSERPELTEADVVVSGGRALKSAEQFKDLLEPLADVLGAALGASRAAVDAGYAPNDWQVGQTGKVVAPKLYFALGISGAIQHLAGMKDSKVIVAINKDPEAPIVENADYILIDDLFKAVPELTAAIKNVKQN